MMDEGEFDERASLALGKLEQALRDEAELEVDLAGGILTIEFADSAKYIINSHAAARQIWLSANFGAAHFGWDGKEWRDTRSGVELFAEVGRLVTEKLSS